MSRWKIYKRSGEWDDVIEGPDVDGVEVVAERDRYRDVLIELEPFLRYTLGEVPSKEWPYCPWAPMDVNPRLRKAVAAISHAHDEERRDG